ncbi:MAG: hypothetical protein U0136_19680 [Bdellovibrionota bacterium]
MKTLRGLVFSFLLLASQSCTKAPYHYFPEAEPPGRFHECPGDQVERGRPNAFFDSIGHYFFSLPTKLILWNWKVENHDISDDTESALREYMCLNHLDDVKVRLNQYAPGGEWKRLSQNTGVSPLWRYSLGAISVLVYTILPGRVFGGDNYNPFTNTINLYSDLPAVALHEAGHAKDFAETEYRGSYAALGILPLVSLWFEGQATGDALGYLQDTQDMCGKQAAYKVLYPAYGTYVGGEALQIVSIFTPVNELVSLVMVIPGHIIGRYQAAQLECPTPPSPTADGTGSHDN